MGQLVLSEAERQALEQAFHLTEDRRLRERCQVVLMAARGRPWAHIAEDVGHSERYVAATLARFRRGGARGLAPRWSAGRERRIPEALVPVLLGWVREGPQAAGAPYPHWTYPRLAEHLRRVHGVRVGRTAVGDLLRAHGVRPYRPTYRFVRADAAAQARAAAQLAQKKRPPPAES